jgi:DhnA family fructose-bisphosphate aldolase class Ia
MAVEKARVNLMHLGRNDLCPPGLRNTVIRERMNAALVRSGGNATTLPIDHLTEHGHLYYGVRGWEKSFDPGALISVANEGRVMAMAVLPGLGQIIGQKTKGTMPLIWKLNYGNVKINGDYACVPVYSNVRDAMKVAADNGAKFWGATFYTGSINTPEMRRQLSELDEAGALEGLGGVVWNYPRGTELKGGDANVYNQLRGFDYIVNACPGSLVLVKEKVSTLPGTKIIDPAESVAQWEKGELSDIGWGKPGEKDCDETTIKTFLSLNRAAQIRHLVGIQHDWGIPSLMSGGAPQKPEQFKKDVEDGLGPDRHIAFIAGRSTIKQINPLENGSFDVSQAVAHMTMLREAAPMVVIEP